MLKENKVELLSPNHYGNTGDENHQLTAISEVTTICICGAFFGPPLPCSERWIKMSEKLTPFSTERCV